MMERHTRQDGCAVFYYPSSIIRHPDLARPPRGRYDLAVLPLIGILIVIVGFALRLNPLLVVATAAIATGFAAGKEAVEVISAFGKAFVDSRSVAVVWLALPVIGMLERAGLKERARTLMAGIS